MMKGNLKLKELRTRRRLSQRQLALLTGLHPSTISRLEVGNRRGRIETFIKLAKALKVPLEDLI